MAALKGAEIDAYLAQPDSRQIALIYGVDAGLVRNELRALGSARRREAAQSGAGDVHPKEKLLVNVLLANKEARAQVLPRLRSLTVVRQFLTWPLLSTMFQLEEAGDDWGFAELEARLEDKHKALLASVVLADSIREQDASLDQALAFLPQLEAKERDARLSELRARATAAEQAGDLEEALRLTEELNRMEKARTPDPPGVVK